MRTLIVSLLVLFLIGCATTSTPAPSPSMADTQGPAVCPYALLWESEAPEYSAMWQAFHLATDWQKPEWDRAEVARIGTQLLVAGADMLQQFNADVQLNPRQRIRCKRMVCRDRAEVALILAKDALAQGEYDKIPGLLHIVLRVGSDPTGSTDVTDMEEVDQIFYAMAKDLAEACAISKAEATVRQYCQIAVLTIMEARSTRIGFVHPAVAHSDILEWRALLDALTEQNQEDPSEDLVSKVCEQIHGTTLFNRYAGPKTRAFVAKWCVPPTQAQP